jgi:hypothetical protein
MTSVHIYKILFRGRTWSRYRLSGAGNTTGFRRRVMATAIPARQLGFPQLLALAA